MFFLCLMATLILSISGGVLLSKGETQTGGILLASGMIFFILTIYFYRRRNKKKDDCALDCISMPDCGDISLFKKLDCDCGDCDCGGIS